MTLRAKDAEEIANMIYDALPTADELAQAMIARAKATRYRIDLLPISAESSHHADMVAVVDAAVAEDAG